MTIKTDVRAAFPLPLNPGEHRRGGPDDGMTLRHYAAIHLRVSDSGTEWLDDMIRQGVRDDLAAKAMQGAMANHHVKETAENRAEWAYEIADAMLAQRENKS